MLGGMALEQCFDLLAADWLVTQAEASSDGARRLAVRGPRGYAKYARLRFAPDPGDGLVSAGPVVSDEGGMPPSDAELIAVALGVLSAYTTTPDDCFFAVWEGGGSIKPAVGAPRLEIPNRGYFLFRGGIADIDYWVKCNARLGARDGEFGELPDPAFVWPADRAWCVANDVDPHFATICGATGSIDKLLISPQLDVVVDAPEVEPPYYSVG